MKLLLRSIPNVSSYRKIPPSELTIPGDAEKFILVPHGEEGIRYIAKAPKKLGIQESLTEYLINVIGMSIPGLKISQSRIARYGSGGQPPKVMFLSLFFHSREERLTHGIQLFGNFYSESELKEFEKGGKERNLYTVENIKASLDMLYPDKCGELFLDFIDMCLFDAVIGNQDRHAKNWGIIEPILRRKEGRIRFAPIFDTARGLFWNVREDLLPTYLAPQKFGGYIERCTPQIAVKQDHKIRHFDLVKFIFDSYEFARPRMRSFIRALETVQILKILDTRPFRFGYSPLRKHLIASCFLQRKTRLSGIIQ